MRVRVQSLSMCIPVRTPLAVSYSYREVMDPLPSGSATVSFISTANLLILGLRMTLPHKVHWRHQWRQHQEVRNAIHIDQIPTDKLEPVTLDGSPLPHEMLSIRTSLFTWPLPGKQPWTRDSRILPNSLNCSTPRSWSVAIQDLPDGGVNPGFWAKTLYLASFGLQTA